MRQLWLSLITWCLSVRLCVSVYDAKYWMALILVFVVLLCPFQKTRCKGIASQRPAEGGTTYGLFVPVFCCEFGGCIPVFGTHIPFDRHLKVRKTNTHSIRLPNARTGSRNARMLFTTCIKKNTHLALCLRNVRTWFFNGAHSTPTWAPLPQF